MNDKEIIEVLKHAIQNVEKGDAAGKGIEFTLGRKTSENPSANLNTVLACLVSYDKLQIKRKTINFNGVEIVAPETEGLKSNSIYFFPSQDFDENGKMEPCSDFWSGNLGDSHTLLARQVWLDEGECQKYCDAHNKMMGVF